MSNSFKLRGYPETILNEAFQKLKLVDRTTLFTYKNKQNINDRPILILIYENKFEKSLS